MKKRILLFMVIFLFSAEFYSLHAQSRARRQAMLENEGERNPIVPKVPLKAEIFSIIGLKIEEAGDFFTISIYFNAAVDTNSLRAEHIFINERRLPSETEFLFNKNRHMARFTMPKTEGEFFIRITNLRSSGGKIMNPTEIKNLEPNSFYKYSRGKNKWQKSSL
ncbi:MAG: hypothetical protein IJ207_00985 [Treponema sp.]|uniref:hypothetical protein n=1 Tax=Treponema sp. TaxID=166 RepID=UPI0025EBEC3B|nr:hypothetical protein [Treponema sp.]MBQ9280759.1 hypothetical protein [Treponema sp.]